MLPNSNLQSSLHSKKPVQEDFFLIQQFITRSARAGRGSYFVTTYRQTESTLKQEKEKEKEKKR